MLIFLSRAAVCSVVPTLVRETTAWYTSPSDGELGHAFRKGTAGAFGPDLAKKLSQLVKMEKNVMRSMETVAKERMDVAVGRDQDTVICRVKLTR